MKQIKRSCIVPLFIIQDKTNSSRIIVRVTNRNIEPNRALGDEKLKVLEYRTISKIMSDATTMMVLLSFQIIYPIKLNKSSLKLRGWASQLNSG